MDSARTSCIENLAERISECLTLELEAVDYASLLLPGGPNFIELYEILSKKRLNWAKVRVALISENFVHSNHQDRFESDLKRHFFQNYAAEAKLISLVQNAENFEVCIKQANVNTHRLIRPLTCVVLDLGIKGQTAGISAAASNYSSLLDFNKNAPDILGSFDPDKVHRCITFTRKALLDTRHLFIHFFGIEKQSLISSGLKQNSNDKLPISRFLQNDPMAEIHWAP